MLVFSRALQHSKSKGVERLVLMSLSDDADNSWLFNSSVKSITVYANCSAQEAIEAVRALEKSGELILEEFDNGIVGGFIAVGFEEPAKLNDKMRKVPWDWAERREAVIQRDGYRCAYCEKQCYSPHVDHIVPVSRGGTHDLSNLTVACPACNLSKGDKLLSEWREARCVS
ncbi:MAG: HNH endonuclease [Pseudomonadota bacterium]